MYDVILWAAIATIVCVVFYSVLGKSVGKDPGSGFDVKETLGINGDKQTAIIPPVEEDFQFEALREIAAVDNGFTSAFFLDGAKGAYSMILEAFAEGNKAMLKNLLNVDVYHTYEAAIDRRNAENLTQVTDLARLISAEIVAAEKKGRQGRISVEFLAELSSAILDADGKTVQGDQDVLARVEEVWTFERDLKASDPNWRLCDVAASSGDEVEADPTPDTKS